ncbi:hypothetical protein OEZ85_006796 [Tetradesmus obliquus]|uniref:Uncharacterized protein n=1 Tax=Tetradesmus obliquus TaxID=3088 RepID=A0ABY8TWG6_TETOB|nr:hypothetical protein OEZ85_006796 [Tetradesmus obliquus]
MNMFGMLINDGTKLKGMPGCSLQDGWAAVLASTTVATAGETDPIPLKHKHLPGAALLLVLQSPDINDSCHPLAARAGILVLQ